MPVRNVVMRVVFQQTIHTIWRRKMAALLALICLGSVILFVQSYSAANPPQPAEYYQKGSNDLGVPIGAHGVAPKPRPEVNVVAPQIQQAIDAPPSEDSTSKGPKYKMPTVPRYAQSEDIHRPPMNNYQQPGAGFSNPQFTGKMGATGARTGGYIPKERLVHFDLKGAHPKVEYIKQVFPVLKKAGATGVLLEWEDTFPYEGRLARLHTSNGYTKDQIREILRAAKDNDLWVMPLIQTFGHMEFVLKLKEFRHLRENDEHFMAICPSKNASFDLLRDMIDQMMALHEGVKYVHIGSDEVYNIGECSLCQSKDRDDLFLSHVKQVAKYLKEKYHVTCVMWDDMLRQIMPERIKKSGLADFVEPMVWSYVKDLYHFVSQSQWQSFSELFPNIWSASAFKGAFGETLTIPDANMHLENNEAWLEVMNDQHSKFREFRGLVITGWQRYDHMAVLCELFPSGFPSLILNLLSVSNGGWSNKLEGKLSQSLKCNNPSSPLDLSRDKYMFERLYGCRFPGWQVFTMIQDHTATVARTRRYLEDVTLSKAWLTEYNFRHNYSLHSRINQGLEEFPQVMYSLTSLVTQARDALRQVFDDYTVAEWIEQNIYPWIEKMEKLKASSTSMRTLRVWEPRPLKMLKALDRYGLKDPREL